MRAIYLIPDCNAGACRAVAYGFSRWALNVLEGNVMAFKIKSFEGVLLPDEVLRDMSIGGAAVRWGSQL